MIDSLMEEVTLSALRVSDIEAECCELKNLILDIYKELKSNLHTSMIWNLVLSNGTINKIRKVADGDYLTKKGERYAEKESCN